MKQTAIITGASSGIGEATAYKFASEGYDLLLIARSTERLTKVKKQALDISSDIKVEILSIDLANFTSSVLLEKLSLLSTPTVLVNNAGIYQQNTTDDQNLKIWSDMFQTNLFGSVQVTQAVWPLFKKQKQGSIVNVASTLGVTPMPGTSAYSASKAAMVNWTTCLAQEGGEYNIRANCVCPGLVETPIHSFYNASVDEKKNIHAGIVKMQLLQKIGQPEHIAESIYFLASEKSSWTTGAIFNIDGGINIK